jgi:hypothetical protein
MATCSYKGGAMMKMTIRVLVTVMMGLELVMVRMVMVRIMLAFL